MDAEKSGWLYLLSVVMFIMSAVIVTMTGIGSGMGVLQGILVNEGMILIPSLIFMFANHGRIKETLHFRAVKITTLLLVILYVILMYPLIGTMNALTMSFTDNAALGISDEVTSLPFFEVFIIFSIAGPLCEELAFRGVIFSGLRKSGKVLGAIVLQGVMFGFMHLNVNQMAYAMVIGIAFGALVEVTGSIWTSFFGHALINTTGLLAMYYLVPAMDSMTGGLSAEGFSMQQASGSRVMLIAALVYGVISIGTTALAMLVLRAIASNEGREDVRRNILRRKAPSEISSGIFSIPAVTALVLAGVYMVITLFIK